MSKDELIKKLINYNTEQEFTDKIELFWTYTNAILNKNLDEIAAEDKNIFIVDPTANLYSKNKLFHFQKDGLHLTEKGNYVIANEIFENLVLSKLIKN